MIFIDWNDVQVSRRLNDGDVITATESNIDPNTIEFVVILAPHRDWWKGLQCLDNTDAQIGFVEASGRGGESGVLSVRLIDVEVGGKLILWKAKTFGVHTPMYVLADLELKKGKRVTFNWTSD